LAKTLSSTLQTTTYQTLGENPPPKAIKEKEVVLNYLGHGRAEGNFKYPSVYQSTEHFPVFVGPQYGNKDQVKKNFERYTTAISVIQKIEGVERQENGVAILTYCHILMNKHAIKNPDEYIIEYKVYGIDGRFTSFREKFGRDHIVAEEGDMIAIRPSCCKLTDVGKMTAIEYDYHCPIGSKLWMLTGKKEKIELKVIGGPLGTGNWKFNFRYTPINGSALVAGMSGSPVFVESDNKIAIVGLHTGVVSKTNEGLCCPFRKPFIQSLSVDKGANFVYMQQENVDFQVCHSNKIDIVPLGPKSILRHLMAEPAFVNGTNHVTILGHDKDVSSMGYSKSRVVETLCHNVFKDKVPGIGPPELKPKEIEKDGKIIYVDSFLVSLANLYTQPRANDMLLANYVVNYVAKSLWRLSGEQPIMSPYSLEQTILGDRANNLTPINWNAAVGYPYNGLKKDYAYVVAGEDVTLHENVYRDMSYALAQIESGISPTTIFKWTLKDEPIKLEKNNEGRVRVFAAGQFWMMLLVRMFFGPFFAWMKEHRRAMPCKVGMNVTSSEYDEFIRDHLEFSDDKDRKKKNSVDGDYPVFDRLLDDFILALNVCILVAIRSGYCEWWITVMKALAVASFRAIILVKGDLIKVETGGNSGSSGTAELNSLDEFIKEVKAYIIAFRNYLQSIDEYSDFSDLVKQLEAGFDFIENVKLGNYGDDNLKTLKDKVKAWYNQETHYKAFKDLGYNMSDSINKSEAPSFKNVTETSFLKRTPIFCPELGQWVAAIEKKSIYKMLTWRVEGILSAAEHAVIICEEAQRMMFCWGRSDYNDFIKNELNLCSSLVAFRIMSYDDQLAFYRECDKEGKAFFADTSGDRADISLSKESKSSTSILCCEAQLLIPST